MHSTSDSSFPEEEAAVVRRKLGSRSSTIAQNGPDPIDVYVGKQLRQARYLAGVSQEKLATAMGVSFQAVQKYEQGVNRVSASRLYKAALLLDRPVSFFFEGYGGAESLEPETTLTADEIKFVRAYRRLSENLRESVLGMVKEIVDQSTE